MRTTSQDSQVGHEVIRITRVVIKIVIFNVAIDLKVRNRFEFVNLPSNLSVILFCKHARFRRDEWKADNLKLVILEKGNTSLGRYRLKIVTV